MEGGGSGCGRPGESEQRKKGGRWEGEKEGVSFAVIAMTAMLMG